jgi:NAD-dependent histone deacetylase SIR2
MFINNEPPSGKEFDDCFDLIVQGSCDEVARQANLKPWTSEDISECAYESSPEPIPQLQSSLHAPTTESFAVVVTPKKRPRTDTGLITPSSSQDEKPAKRPATKATKKVTNPASKGRSIKELLKSTKAAPAKAAPKTAAKSTPKPAPKAVQKAAPKPRAKAAAASKKGGKAPAKPNATITMFNTRVTKNSIAAGTTDTKTTGKAMHPVPAGAPKNNGPLFKVTRQSGKADIKLDFESRPQSVASS